jgi:hypothetical protein
MSITELPNWFKYTCGRLALFVMRYHDLVCELWLNSFVLFKSITRQKNVIARRCRDLCVQHIIYPLGFPSFPLMMLVSDEASTRYHASACQDFLVWAILIITECSISCWNWVLRDLVVEDSLRNELLIVLLRMWFPYWRDLCRASKVLCLRYTRLGR